MTKWLNILIMFCLPVAWLTPVIAYGLDPEWDRTTQTIIGGISKLWESDKVLAVIVAILAIVAPLVKTSATALMQFNIISSKWMPIANIASRLAFTDILLIALTIIITKGIGVGFVEPQWGIYLFTACVAAGYYITQKETQHVRTSNNS